MLNAGLLSSAEFSFEIIVFIKIYLSGLQVGYQTVCIRLKPNMFSLNLASAVDKFYHRANM